MEETVFEYSCYAITKENETVTDWVRVKEQSLSTFGSVAAVFAKALLNTPLNSECGMCIDITVKNGITSYMANYRHSEFWCRPFFGTDLTKIPDETQALVLELSKGYFCVVVPVVNDTYKCVLAGNQSGGFTAKLFSWCKNLQTVNGLAFVYACGENPARLVESCVKSALQILNNGTRHREERRYPESFEYLGWCSWDSMQINVNEQGLLEKCGEFQEKGIPVKWAIIDDMWAEIRDFYGQTYSSFQEMVSLMHRSALYHFQADPLRFPNGLKHCIEKMNEKGITVGMWHPTTGYWRGIAPDGEAFHCLKDNLISSETGALVPDWHCGKSYLYYKTLHDFFIRCGAAFVKIDNQSMTRRFYKNLAPVGTVAKSFHDGMEASVGEHFDNRMINCMGMASEDMWSRSFSPISRCSDDFLPENRAWFAKHILQCAYNSFLQGQFYWCDWDMWWTDDGQAEKNSLLRAISGGPIYVSDKIGRSRKEVLSPLALSNGKILRCDRPCIPTKDCITQDPTKGSRALKLQNMAGDCGIMAIFNINEDENTVTADISDEWIDGSCADEYAVYEHFTQELTILKRGEHIKVTLHSPDDYRLYIFVPLNDGFAVIGRTDKFISPKTIQCVIGQEFILKENGPCAYVKDRKLHVIN